MTTFQPLTFAYGETWSLDFDCQDQEGNLFTPAAVAIRAISQSGVVVDEAAGPNAASPLITWQGSAVTVAVPAAMQQFGAASVPQFFTYAVRAWNSAGEAIDQLAGSARVMPSPFALYPFTPPIAPTSGGDLSFDSGTTTVTLLGG